MRTASEQFRACVKLCHAHALRRVEVANRHMIGWTRLHLMELLEAEEDALASMQLATEVSHPRAQLLGLMLAGNVNYEMGQLEKADRFLQQALELAQSIHADNFLANSLHLLAENSLAQGDKAKAQVYASQGVEIVRKVGMTFIGPAVLASKAASADDEIRAQEALKEAEAILDSGCVSHNHFWFARIAIGHSLRTHAWDEVERYAIELESYTRREPLPWSDFIMANGRALAAWGRGSRTDALARELQRLQSIAAERGLMLDAEMLEKALASA